MVVVQDAPVIDVIVPVLGRPQNADPVYMSFAANSLPGCQLVFVCSAADDPQIAACRATGARTLVHPEKPGRGNYAKKINWAFARTDSEFVFNGSDDIMFTLGWSETALRMMRGNVAVVATNDKANRQVMRGEFGTHCLIRRAYIDETGGTADNQPGVVLHEGYDHNFVDRELCEVAKHRRRYKFARNSVVEHRHPLWRTAPWDPTYRKALARFRDDQKLFAERSPLWKPTRQRDIVAR